MSQFIQKRKPIEAGIDLTPLIDVVFQLLIFLLVSSYFVKPERKVDLPSGGLSRTEEVEPLAHVLTISADNVLTLNAQPLQREELVAAFEQLVEAGQSQRLEIRGDQQADLGLFIEVLEYSKAAGIESRSYRKSAE